LLAGAALTAIVRARDGGGSELFAEGKLIVLEIKNLEIEQELSRLPQLKDEPVMLSLKVPVATGAVRVRLW